MKPQSSSVMPNQSLPATTVRIFCQSPQVENASSQKEAHSRSKYDFVYLIFDNYLISFYLVKIHLLQIHSLQIHSLHIYSLQIYSIIYSPIIFLFIHILIIQAFIRIQTISYLSTSHFQLLPTIPFIIFSFF